MLPLKNNDNCVQVAWKRTLKERDFDTVEVTITQSYHRFCNWQCLLKHVCIHCKHENKFKLNFVVWNHLWIPWLVFQL